MLSLVLAGCGGGAKAPHVAPLPRERVTPGVALRADRLGDSAYAETAARLFASVTPENEMKWLSTEPQPGQFSFAAGDRIADFAHAHRMRVHGHALIWHLQAPAWVDGSPEVMRRHIEGVVGHYRGRVAEWDVVNEALSDEGGFRPTPFLRAQGPEYIAAAFRIAHAADPGARLVYNDYGAESPDTPKGQALYRLVEGLRKLHVPIDAVGFQTHATPALIPGFVDQLRRIAALGVDVELTEVDVRLPAHPSRADLDAQAVAYRRIVDACVSVARCRAITFWGLDDGDSWIPEFYPGSGSALLLDDKLRPKPAYAAVAARMRGRG